MLKQVSNLKFPLPPPPPASSSSSPPSLTWRRPFTLSVGVPVLLLPFYLMSFHVSDIRLIL